MGPLTPSKLPFSDTSHLLSYWSCLTLCRRSPCLVQWVQFLRVVSSETTRESPWVLSLLPNIVHSPGFSRFGIRFFWREPGEREGSREYGESLPDSETSRFFFVSPSLIHRWCGDPGRCSPDEFRRGSTPSFLLKRDWSQIYNYKPRSVKDEHLTRTENTEFYWSFRSRKKVHDSF